MQRTGQQIPYSGQPCRYGCCPPQMACQSPQCTLHGDHSEPESPIVRPDVIIWCKSLNILHEFEGEQRCCDKSNKVASWR